MGYDRRVSVTPSHYSSGSSSISHSSQQQSYPNPGQPSRNPANPSPYGYPQGGGGPSGQLAPMYSASQPNLGIPPPGIQRSRTQSSQRSTINDGVSWDGVPSGPAGQGYGGGPVGGPPPAGGLTPAQAYQAQVGEGAGTATQYHRPGAYLPNHVQQSSSPYLGSPSPSSNSSYSAPSPNSQVSLSPPPTHPNGPRLPNPPSAYPIAPPSSYASNGAHPPRLPTFENAMGDGLGLSDLPNINFDEFGAGAATPRPTANDDSELGYLGGGASGNTSSESDRSLSSPFRWRCYRLGSAPERGGVGGRTAKLTITPGSDPSLFQLPRRYTPLGIRRSGLAIPERLPSRRRDRSRPRAGNRMAPSAASSRVSPSVHLC